MTKLKFIGKVPESLMMPSGKPVKLEKGDIVEVSDRWVPAMLRLQQQVVTQHVKKEKDTDFNITTYTTEFFPAYELVEEKKSKSKEKED